MTLLKIILLSIFIHSFFWGNTVLASNAIQQGPTSIAASFIKDTQAPKIDGDLSDIIWETVPKHENFQQFKPFPDKAPSEKTWFKIAYDEENFYIAVYLENKQVPIVYASSKRDTSLTHGDSIGILFDPLQRGQQGYLFGSNPNGALFDSLIKDGSNNSNWNGIWEVKTKTSSHAWQAEFKIPIENFVFDPLKNTWNINLIRYIAHHQEELSISHIPQNKSNQSLQYLIALQGIRLKTKNTLKISPYLLNQYQSSNEKYSLKGGGDLLFKQGSQRSLQISLNTDFAQTEVDDQQVQLNQFSLFYPEKRQFFLKNQDFFRISTGRYFRNFEMFFSRKIGLADDEIIPVQGGINYFENRGNHQLGVINMITAAKGNIAQTNYNVLRYKNILGRKRHVGFMMTNKDLLGSGNNDYNRVIGIDSQYKVNQELEFNGFLVKSLDNSNKADTLSSYLTAGYRAANYVVWGNHLYGGKDFDPQMGYVQETDLHLFRLGYSYYWYTPTPSIRQSFVRTSTYQKYDTAFKFKQQKYNLSAAVDWHSNWNLEWNLSKDKEKIFEPIDLYDIIIPVNTYEKIRNTFKINKKKIGSYAVYFTGSFGGYYNGELTDLGINAAYKLNRDFTIRAGLRQLKASLKPKGFDFYLANIGLDLQFNPQSNAALKIQYNDESKNLSANLIYRYFFNSQDGLFFIMNYVNEKDALPESESQIMLKYTRTFGIL